MLIYHVYVRDGVGNAIVRIRNDPFVRLFRSNDGSLKNGFSVFRVPMPSKGTFSDVATDGI